MVLKSSWVVLAVMFLAQSSVLTVPVKQDKQEFPMDPTDFLPKGMFNDDKNKPSFPGFNPFEGFNSTSPGDIPFIPGMNDPQGADSYVLPAKGKHGSISDPSSRNPTSRPAGGMRFPGAKPYSGSQSGSTQDPSWSREPNNSSAYPDDQNEDDSFGKKLSKPAVDPASSTGHGNNNTVYPVGPNHGDSYGKKMTKPVDGTITDSTFTNDANNSTTYPGDQNGSDSYVKRTTKPVDGSISDPTFTDEPSNCTDYPSVGQYNDGNYTTKLGDGSISDPTSTEEDPKNSSSSYPVGDYYHKKNPTKGINGTISDPLSRQGHTPSGKPCIVPSSGQHDRLSHDDENVSYLGGKENHCTPDLDQKSIRDDQDSFPYSFGNGDDTDKTS